ncbi:Dam family site-specific DNA-(adenine-N6)-methyltransferase [Enterobacter hormaechei]
MGDCCHTLSAESGTTGKGDSAPCVATYTAPAIGHFKADDVSSTLTRSAGQGNGETQNGAFIVNAEPTAMAFAENDRNEVRYIDGDGQITAPVQCGGGKPGQGYQAVVEMPQMSVRRLTPFECELLQGMPGDHTLIPTGKYKKLIDDELAYLRYHAPELPEDMLMKMAADGPRYKAIGNSMAVPVMRWIMERILLQVQPADHVEDFGNDEPPAPDVKPKAKKVKQKAEKVKLPPEYTRSPLKWAGGKYLLLKELLNAMPPGVRLVEPFVGGGSVFLNAGLKNQFSRFLLADINADLVNLYQMLAIVPQQVTDAAKVFYADFNTPSQYQTVKDAFNAHDMDAVTRAAAFLFINRHCFNGLIRYNQQGIFNVGYGKYEAPYFPESEIVDFIRVAPSCVFLNAGFEKTLSLAGAGDVVYCDPPYEPMPGKDGFTGYAAGGFKWEQQVALAQACVDAHKRGAEVLITNSGAPKILELYKAHGMKVQDINAKRSISSKGSTREIATDILATLIHERTDES